MSERCINYSQDIHEVFTKFMSEMYTHLGSLYRRTFDATSLTALSRNLEVSDNTFLIFEAKLKSANTKLKGLRSNPNTNQLDKLQNANGALVSGQHDLALKICLATKSDPLKNINKLRFELNRRARVREEAKKDTTETEARINVITRTLVSSLRSSLPTWRKVFGKKDKLEEAATDISKITKKLKMELNGDYAGAQKDLLF